MMPSIWCWPAGHSKTAFGQNMYIQMHIKETHLNRNCSFSPCVGYPSHVHCWLLLDINYEINFFSVSFARVLCNRTFTNGNNS
jgi:hypothetical protein